MFDPSNKKLPDFQAPSDLFLSQDNLDLAILGLTDSPDCLEEEPEPGLETNLLYSMDGLDLFLCTSDELEQEAERRRAQKAREEAKPE